VRIPKLVAVESQIEENSVLEVSFIRGKISLKRVSGRKYSLEELLKQVSKNNLHGEVVTGPPVGREEI
jgi:antitoxin MazE